jgi:predicted RNase H-like HicB family nuclease
VETKKVTVIVYPDEDGGFTAVMPYFNCSLVSQGTCLTAQGWTSDEALTEARVLLEQYLSSTGAEGLAHLENARLEGLEVRELEVELNGS